MTSVCEFVNDMYGVFRSIRVGTARSTLLCDQTARLELHSVVVHHPLHAVDERDLLDQATRATRSGEKQCTDSHLHLRTT